MLLPPEEHIYQQVIGLLVSTGREHPSQHKMLGPDTVRSIGVLFLHHGFQISEAHFCGRLTHIVSKPSHFLMHREFYISK